MNLGPPRPGRLLRRVALVLVAVAPAISGCSRSTPAQDAFDLYRGLLLAGRVEVNLPPHGADDARRVAEERLQRLASSIEARTDLEVVVRRPAEPADPGAARVWIGDARTPGAGELLEILGVQRNEEGFLVGEHVFPKRGDMLTATFEDPERPGLPLSVWYGNDLLLLERSIEDLTPAWRPLLRCLRAGRPELEIDLTVRGEPRVGSERDVGRARREARADVRTTTLAPFQLELPADFDLADWREHYFASLPAVLARIEASLGRPEDFEARELLLRVHAQPEDFALETGSAAPFRVDPARNSVDVLLAPRVFGGRADARVGAAAAWARELAGDPAEPWMLEALAVEASGFWWGRSLEEWVAYLSDGDLVPPFGELTDSSSRISPHVLQPLRAMLLRYLRLSKGPGTLRTMWKGTREFSWNPKLKEGFEAALGANLERERETVRARRADHHAAATGRAWRAGVALVAGDGPTHGYGSRAARGSLSAASALGADAFSLELFAYVEPGLPERAGVAPPARSSSDTALAMTIADGRSLGLGGMIKLHLVQERSSNFAAYRGMADADWAPFFDEYERQVVHVGLLAELSGAEILCLGSGVPLPTATRPREGDGADLGLLAWKLARWEALIARARGAFSGALTYGARWLNQAYSIDFWPQLDYVGVQAFHPVRDASEPWVRQTDVRMVAMMRKNLTDLAELAERVGKPLLATEVGFPATRWAWQDPSSAQGPLDPDEQARMLALWTRSLVEARERRSELAGFFLWSWPVDSSAPLGAAGLFSPRGRPAEAALDRLLGLR